MTPVRRGSIATPIVAAALLAFGARGAGAQQQAGSPAQVAPRSAAQTGAPIRGMLPISQTTVMHYALESGPDGALHLGYVLLVRGEPGWWRTSSGSSTERTDSTLEVQQWTVGTVKYTIGYSRQPDRLQTFGEMVNLRWAPVVFVTLDSTDPHGGRLQAGPISRFTMAAPPTTFPAAFMLQTPEARQFAGLP